MGSRKTAGWMGIVWVDGKVGAVIQDVTWWKPSRSNHNFFEEWIVENKNCAFLFHYEAVREMIAKNFIFINFYLLKIFETLDLPTTRDSFNKNRLRK